ncbi:MAG: hypothetical protein ACYDCS_14160 [Candidatus Dormibacteria bacterium]
MAADESAGPGRRVVIATGEPAIARILSHKLRREGHSITTVADATALDSVLASNSIDIALVDVAIAGESAAPIAARVSTGWLAIIDGREPQAASRAMRSGAAGLVRTPFKPTAVAAQVATLLTLMPR